MLAGPRIAMSLNLYLGASAKKLSRSGIGDIRLYIERELHVLHSSFRDIFEASPLSRQMTARQPSNGTTPVRRNRFMNLNVTVDIMEPAIQRPEFFLCNCGEIYSKYCAIDTLSFQSDEVTSLAGE
jgi:hypothetical protein